MSLLTNAGTHTANNKIKSEYNSNHNNYNSAIGYYEFITNAALILIIFIITMASDFEKPLMLLFSCKNTCRNKMIERVRSVPKPNLLNL